jgi:hypothetical protein
MDDGFVESSDRLAEYQARAGLVRRVLQPSDRIALGRALTALRHHGGLMPEDLRALDRAWHDLGQELDSTITLDGAAITRREVLLDWLAAATFHNHREFKDSYGRFLDRRGRAAERIAAELTDQIGGLVLRIDASIAAALDEPIDLPPAPRFVPADDRPWWKRLFGRRPS